MINVVPRLTITCILFTALATLFFCSVTAEAGDGPAKRKHHVVFLISEDPDNYEATRTVPVFAETLRKDHGFDVTVLLGEGKRTEFRFPGLEVLKDADLLVVFCRRVALATEQLNIIKDYLKVGKPVVGIRTANHAFTMREPVSAGHEGWPAFVSDILGCENRGYGPEPLGTRVSLVPEQRDHFIVRGITPTSWHGEGSTYLVAPLLDERATVLALGSVEDKTEPVAWTRLTADKSRVFYTSLGYPSDFDRPQFNQLLVNGIYWALNKKVK